MGPLAFLYHLCNLFLPALALAALAAALAKLAWRGELREASWWQLAWPAALANALVTLGGLAVFMRDGKMATYAAMVLASTAMLWWRGFGPGRR